MKKFDVKVTACFGNSVVLDNVEEVVLNDLYELFENDPFTVKVEVKDIETKEVVETKEYNDKLISQLIKASGMTEEDLKQMREEVQQEMSGEDIEIDVIVIEGDMVA